MKKVVVAVLLGILPALTRAFTAQVLKGPLLAPTICRAETISGSGPSSASIESVQEASNILQEWDRYYNTASSAETEMPEDMKALRGKLPQAVLFLNEVATEQRLEDSTQGRCMLGICASSGAEGLAALKSWVTNLQLPRGLLHGMDKDGVPLNLEEGVYIKYNSGGLYTFEEIRKSGLGFDALWKPGDALLELYDGDYRGVYFQVELCDEEFRQYLVPLDLFSLE